MNIVVLISGTGSNLQAIIDACQHGLPVTVQAVISNRPNAEGLNRATKARINTHCLDHTVFESREAFDTALAEQINHYQPDLIVLAGFMRRLGSAFVQQFTGKIINIHPSLLPKYPGLNTHQRALDQGDAEHGVTIHYVTEDLDAGPIIATARLRIEPKDTPKRLKARIQALEHRLYPETLGMLANKIINKSQS